MLAKSLSDGLTLKNRFHVDVASSKDGTENIPKTARSLMRAYSMPIQHVPQWKIREHARPIFISM
jgi:hypothetical protein